MTVLPFFHDPRENCWKYSNIDLLKVTSVFNRLNISHKTRGVFWTSQKLKRKKKHHCETLDVLNLTFAISH